MNYKQAAIDDLRHHAQRKEALQSLNNRIIALAAALESYPVPGPDTVSVTGTKPHPEIKWIDYIVQKQRLERTRDVTKSVVNAVEKGLASLSDRQKDLLIKSYDSRCSLPLSQLCAEFSVSKSELYRERENALFSFTIAMYGMVFP